MKSLALTQGKVALVDDNDFEYLSRWKWCYNNGYAVRSGGVSLHRAILSPPRSSDIDHINGDRLDNRRANLRLCSRAENCRNRKPRSGSTTGMKGVYLHKPSGRYQASIRVNGKNLSQGMYDSITEAAKAYNKAARKYFGDFAYINNIRKETL